MLDQPGFGIGRGHPLAARLAQDQRRIASAVEEQQALLAALQPRLHLFDQPRGEPAAAFGRLCTQVNDLNMR